MNIDEKNSPAETKGEALAVIPFAGRKLSFFRSITCNLVLFPDQFIHATYTKELLNKEVQKKKLEYEEEKGEPIKAGRIQFGVSLYFYARYFDLTPETILQEHPQNFAIPLKDITYLQYSFDAREMSSEEESAKRFRPGNLQIKTEYFEWNYRFSSIPAPELIKALREMIPDIQIHEGYLQYP